MLVRPDDRAKRALKMLRSPDMLPVLEWLARENGANIAVLMNQTDVVQLHRAQGRAQFIDDLLRLVQQED